MPINWRETFGDDPDQEIPGIRIRYTSQWPTGVHQHGPSQDPRQRRPDCQTNAYTFLRGKRRE